MGGHNQFLKLPRSLHHLVSCIPVREEGSGGERGRGVNSLKQFSRYVHVWADKGELHGDVTTGLTYTNTDAPCPTCLAAEMSPSDQREFFL